MIEYVNNWFGKNEVQEGGALKLIEPSKEYLDKLLEMEQEENFFNSLNPTEKQLLEAEIEIKILTTLMEVGII